MKQIELYDYRASLGAPDKPDFLEDAVCLTISFTEEFVQAYKREFDFSAEDLAQWMKSFVEVNIFTYFTNQEAALFQPLFEHVLQGGNSNLVLRCLHRCIAQGGRNDKGSCKQNTHGATARAAHQRTEQP